MITSNKPSSLWYSDRQIRRPAPGLSHINLVRCSVQISFISWGGHCDAGSRPETEGTGNSLTVAPDRPTRRKARALTSTSVPACAFPQIPRRTKRTVLTGRHSPALCSSPHRRAAAHLPPSPFACLPFDTNLPGLPLVEWSGAVVARPLLPLDAWSTHVGLRDKTSHPVCHSGSTGRPRWTLAACPECKVELERSCRTCLGRLQHVATRNVVLYVDGAFQSATSAEGS